VAPIPTDGTASSLKTDSWRRGPARARIPSGIQVEREATAGKAAARHLSPKMPPNIFKIRSALHGRPARAFSLIELLVVMGILSIVLTLAVSGFQRLAQGSPLDRAINGISAGFELARQAAVAQSTYTWVCLAEDEVEGKGNVITMAILASKNGDLSSSKKGDVKLINRIEEFPGVKLHSGSLNKFGDQIPASSLANVEELVEPLSDISFSDQLPKWAQERNFGDGVAIMFSPQGEAMIYRGEESVADIDIYEGLYLMVVPAKGTNPSEIEEKSASVVYVNGLTGLPRVYQPGLR